MLLNLRFCADSIPSALTIFSITYHNCYRIIFETLTKISKISSVAQDLILI
jgi:hypothetical protein